MCVPCLCLLLVDGASPAEGLVKAQCVTCWLFALCDTPACRRSANITTANTSHDLPLRIQLSSLLLISVLMPPMDSPSHNGDNGSIVAATPDEVFHLRGYQAEMVAESMKANIIVVMDTGSGKTHM